MEEKNETAMPKSNFSMLSDNGILYRAPSQLSSVVARTYKVEYAQRSLYTKTAPIIFDWNTGTSYVDPQTAILSFDILLSKTNVENASVSWGGGLGACNLISEIRIISKNGVELDRCSEAGQLAKILSDWTMSAETRDNLGMCDGVDFLDGEAVPIALEGTAVTTVKVSIPIKVLSGFFRPTVKGMLLPAGLASGLRIEMSLMDEKRAFQAETGVIEGLKYEIENPQMLLQLSDFNDPTQNLLITESARAGLEYNFPSYFSTTVSNASGDKIREQLKKAVSQANKVFAVVLNADAVNGYETLERSGFDSMPSSQIKSFNYRVGSQYYPLERLTRPSDYWAIASAAFDELRNMEWRPNQLNYLNFNTGGKCLAAASLDMSDRINLSGSKINNSSVLELRMDLLNTNKVDVMVFLQFTAEARVSGSRSVLKI